MEGIEWMTSVCVCNVHMYLKCTYMFMGQVKLCIGNMYTSRILHTS